MTNLKFILIVILNIIISCNIFFAQNTSKTIPQLQVEKQEAVKNEDFILADKLKTQIDARVFFLKSELEQALKQENFLNATQIKKELDSLNKISTNDAYALTKEEPTNQTIIPNQNIPKLIENGFFLDILSGTSMFNGFYVYEREDSWGDMGDTSPLRSYSYNSGLAPGIGFKIGNQWYFGSGEIRKAGFQITWLRLSVYVDRNYSLALIHIAPLNIGYTHVFTISGNRIIEANFNTGLSTTIVEEVAMDQKFGYLINPELKLRKNKFSIGLDITYSKMTGTEHKLQSSFFTTCLITGYKF